MANTAAGALAVCPFYLSDSKMTITCEGLTEKGKTADGCQLFKAL